MFAHGGYVVMMNCDQWLQMIAITNGELMIDTDITRGWLVIHDRG